jgi:tRNA/rRNA methyltransferase
VGVGRLGLVFGPEASGLTNEELGLCHAHITISTDPAHPSLNLAQAVAILAYEARTANPEDGAPDRDGPVRADLGELERAIAELGEGLRGIGYLNPSCPGPILAELRRLLARAGPTRREVTLLRGIARQIRWAARRVAGGPAADA